ncbi:ubiquitinyl hydrolase 1 [Malassezia psittaci]|uniref:Ubiquitin carboxyl-terminal hydrolase n=1 Tax=Malassezia psittaci TaxID=1821823 RepID=A0AAF0F2Z7_9BASI|nr:ubiquitinyl hydrolase 1 [Malassezia psittaci]
MSTVPVKVKHNGQVYEVELNTLAQGRAFKEAIALQTQVPPERQKVMIKGGLLKFMVLGTAGDLPQAPSKPIQFMEDMQDDELARASNQKVGLINLGQTCYLNSTLQLLRCIPELNKALDAYSGNINASDGDASLTAALRDLFREMDKTSKPFPPLLFLTVLRKVAPQFAEMAQGGGGYAQQDAEEVYVRILNALGNYLPSVNGQERFVPENLTGRMTIKRSCAEADQEPETQSTDPFLALQCNISSSTNDMIAGILDTLTQRIEKHSEQLGRTAVYTEQSRIARLPIYLSVHFVRFYWRRDINKKTKIMRKVKFPMELDASVFASDELKSRVSPLSQKIKLVAKEREERAKVRRRVKALGHSQAAPSDSQDDKQETTQQGAAISDDEERSLRQKEREDLASSIDPDLKLDAGCNPSGLYDLAAIVTHKGAAADAGHYMSWVRKENDSRDEFDTMPSEEWYQFNDDKVSVVNTEKITTLYGGGEDSVAYILLYRARSLQ